MYFVRLNHKLDTKQAAMPLVISKNKLTYEADSAEQQVEFTAPNAITIAGGGAYYALPELTLKEEDKIHHVLMSAHMQFQGVAQASLPTVTVLHTLLNGSTHHTGWVQASEDNHFRGSSHSAVDSPIVSTEVRIYGPFTVPAGSKFHIGFTGNDAALVNINLD